MNDDTDRIAIECDDTDREIVAQAVLETTAQMFEDTGVVIIDKPADEPAPSDHLVITFRSSPKLRASTESWPPAPRAPAPPAIRAPRQAAVLAAVRLKKR